MGSNSVFSSEKWDAVGGSGGTNPGTWNVQNDDTVPVRYDLRPLSDLLSPIFFPDEWDSPDRRRFVAGRANLETAIVRYMAALPRLSDKAMGPKVYRVTFHSLVCFSNGDEGKTPAEISGKVEALLNGTDGQEKEVLFGFAGKPGH